MGTFRIPCEIQQMFVRRSYERTNERTNVECLGDRLDGLARAHNHTKEPKEIERDVHTHTMSCQ